MSEKTRATLGGKKKLTLVDATAQSVGLMGPVFSIAFLVPLVVGITSATGNGAGTAAPLAVVIGAVGVLGLGWIIAEYSKRIHSAGSLYDYVTDGLGGRVGSAAGWLYYTGILALGAGILPMIGGTIHDTLQGEFNVTPLPYLGWDLILLVVVGLVIHLGVTLSTRTQLTLALISFTVVGIFSVVVIVRSGGLHHVSSGFSPSGSSTGWRGVMFGVLYGVLLFTGFETAANLGEETERPEKNIPRAVLTAVLAVSAFYIVGSFAQVAGFHFSLKALGNAAGAGPLFVLAGPGAGGGFGGVALRRIVELVVVLDMLAVLIGTAVAASRGIFALSRDERLPRGLSGVSSRGTPFGASNLTLLVYLAIIAGVQWTSWFALPKTPEYVSMFSWMSTYGGFAIVVIYLLISVGALRGLRDHPRVWAVVLSALVGIAVTVAAIYGSIYKVGAPTKWAPYSAVAILVMGLVAAIVMRPAPSGQSDFTPLKESEQGPVKL
ncbi:MAG: APC family permease [Acidimicrobiaceae bacterium]|nr:APC family permease [Acidimicrobiaceae bacterium]